jgi:hypothetical protein
VFVKGPEASLQTIRRWLDSTKEAFHFDNSIAEATLSLAKPGAEQKDEAILWQSRLAVRPGQLSDPHERVLQKKPVRA